MDTTAEGVETHDELELVRLLGRSHVQGHIYFTPMNAAEAGALASGSLDRQTQRAAIRAGRAQGAASASR